MVKYIFILFLSLFQDNYVRIGTIIGLLIGFWSSEILKIYPTTKFFAFGFIGWGIGVYLANYLDVIKKSSKKKFRFIKGGKK